MKALRKVSLTSVGVWFYVRRVIEKESRRRGFLWRDRKPISLAEALCAFGRDGPAHDEANLSENELVKVGLLRRADDGTELFSPWLQKLDYLRSADAKRMREGRRKKRELKTPIIAAENNESSERSPNVRRTFKRTPLPSSPLEVSSPYNPLLPNPPSTPPPPSLTAQRAGAREAGIDPESGWSPIELAAIAAMDRWSERDRGHSVGGGANMNEMPFVLALVNNRLAKGTIMAGGTRVLASSVIPSAVEHLMQDQRFFKSVKYACESIYGLLKEWQRTGGVPAKQEFGHAEEPRAAPPQSPSFASNGHASSRRLTRAEERQLEFERELDALIPNENSDEQK